MNRWAAESLCRNEPLTFRRLGQGLLILGSIVLGAAIVAMALSYEDACDATLSESALRACEDGSFASTGQLLLLGLTGAVVLAAGWLTVRFSQRSAADRPQD